MKHIREADILKNQPIATDLWEMVVEAKDIADTATVGQFVNLYIGKGELLLPRPISICEILKEKNSLRFIYGVVGKGTKELTHKAVGEKIQILGPIGTGFQIKEEIQDHIVIGGGIGTPPLLELVKNLQGNVSVYLGFRSEPILIEEFEQLGAKVYVATDDGSAGIKGTVIHLLQKHTPTAQMIYACGPKAMLAALAQWAAQKEIPIQVSMEERMACGIGACVGCTCKTQKQGEEDWQHLKVCKDGPVFWGNEVIWYE